MKIIKFIVALLISTTLLISCRSNKPDNKQYGLEVKENGFRPGALPKNITSPVYDTIVQISPTWSQANYYASKRGDFLVWQIIGSILLLTAVVLIYGKATEASWIKIEGSPLGIILFVLLSLSLTSFKWQASNIKWNNDIWVPKPQFDKSIQENGTIKPIWDSLEKEYRIVFGPYKK